MKNKRVLDVLSVGYGLVHPIPITLVKKGEYRASAADSLGLIIEGTAKSKKGAIKELAGIIEHEYLNYACNPNHLVGAALDSFQKMDKYVRMLTPIHPSKLDAYTSHGSCPYHGIASILEQYFPQHFPNAQGIDELRFVHAPKPETFFATYTSEKDKIKPGLAEFRFVTSGSLDQIKTELDFRKDDQPIELRVINYNNNLTLFVRP